jgi:hypothetical protein
LRARRLAVATSRDSLRRVRPRRPPEHTAEVVRALSATPADESFITGNGFAARCRYVLNYDELQVQDSIRNNWWFCKSEYLEYFFRSVAPREPFVLFSHNSDRAIDSTFRRQLRRRDLVTWFAANLAITHPKLQAIPVGIANPRWQHGNQGLFKRAQAAHAAKTNLFEASYDRLTNMEERDYCTEQTGIEPDRNASLEKYVATLASSYFCISPRGNGIDCHRTWEALYLRAVPVVTRNVLVDQHRDLPMIVLDDWSQFGSIDFTPELYEKTIGSWDPASIRLDRYFERIEANLKASP